MERLIALAGDGRTPARAQLLAGVTDLLIAAGGVSAAASELYADIVLRLIDRVDHSDRIALATRLARLAVTPPSVAFDLARRPIEVALPVLRHSPVLSDADLVALIAELSQDHLLAVATRDALSAMVTDGLVAHGGRPVLRTATGNAGAEFSLLGFRRLVAVALEDAGLQEALILRADLPDDVAAELAPMLPQQLRGRAKRMGVAAAPAQRKSSASARLAATLGAGETDLSTVVGELAARDRLPDIARMFALLADLPETVVARQLFQRGDAGFMALFKGLGISQAGFAAAVQARARRLPVLAGGEERLLAAYPELPADDAVRALERLKARRRHPGMIATLAATTAGSRR